MRTALVFAAALMALILIDLTSLTQNLAETAVSDAQVRMAGPRVTDVMSRM